MDPTEVGASASSWEGLTCRSKTAIEILDALMTDESVSATFLVYLKLSIAILRRNSRPVPNLEQFMDARLFDSH